MSTAAGAPSNGANQGVKSPQSKDKGKGKSTVTSPDASMEVDDDDEEDDEEDDDEMEGADDDDEGEDSEEGEDEIDPSAILRSSRRTRAKVDYSSKEAHEKAGLKPEEEDDDDDDEME